MLCRLQFADLKASLALFFTCIFNVRHITKDLGVHTLLTLAKYVLLFQKELKKSIIFASQKPLTIRAMSNGQGSLQEHNRGRYSFPGKKQKCSQKAVLHPKLGQVGSGSLCGCLQGGNLSNIIFIFPENWAKSVSGASQKTDLHQNFANWAPGSGKHNYMLLKVYCFTIYGPCSNICLLLLCNKEHRTPKVFLLNWWLSGFSCSPKPPGRFAKLWV